MRVRRRRSRVVVAVLLVVSLTAAACSTSPGEGSGGEAVRDAAAGAIAAKVVSGAGAAFSKLSACMANREVGQPCAASDSANIRATLAEVRELRAEIAANQDQALKELDSIKAMIRDSEVKRQADNLREMEINTRLAGEAYEALVQCAASTASTCQPFIGGLTAPPEDVATAIAKTRGYLLELAALLPKSLPVTASWFTGTRTFDNGLADAIWMYNKGIQDAAAGADTAADNSPTIPVVTPGLANSQNQDIEYWANLFSEYAFVAVLAGGMLGGESVAERRQAEADRFILNTASRESVFGTAGHYSLPPIGGTGVVLADGGRAWLVADGTVSPGRPLEPGDVADLARVVSTYTSVEKLAQVPRAMPPDRWYTVRTPIERVNYPRLELWAMGGFGVTSKLATWTNVDAAWLVDGASARDFCPSRVRPVSSPPARKSGALDVDNDLWVEPEFVPESRLTSTWERFASGKPIEFTWAGKRAGDIDMGWGAWVACDGSRAQGTLVELSLVPGVMGPVASRP